MTLTHIAVFSAGALFYSLFLPSRWRGWALMLLSVIAIFWLQPALAIRWLDFSLPIVTLTITVIGWLITRQNERLLFDDRIALGVTFALILVLSATRYLTPELRITSRPPDILVVVLALLITTGLVATLWRLLRGWTHLYAASIVIVIAVFAIIKTESLTIWLSSLLRAQTGQDTTLAGVIDIQWLGFSYVAFRLIHTLRDRQMGVLPALSLREYLTYVVFFPAFTAGPIDRAERFIEDYRALPEMIGRHAPRMVEGTSRITVGLFKKFVIADSLALFSLGVTNAAQPTDSLGVWILLYTYAFRLFLDFSGYSDIAIGIGILFGIKLPENFDRPYVKNNIASFWQSWHMTLSNWRAFYVFSPLSRALLRRPSRPSNEIIMFICHMSTMLVIGLWHGVTWTFVLWAAWHGLGLWVHKLWTDRTRKWYIGLRERPRVKFVWTVAGVLITFHFVVLGWVWFALPNVDSALSVFSKLFGGRIMTGWDWLTKPAQPYSGRFIFRVLIKTVVLFILFNLIFAWLDPLPSLGSVSIYNGIATGRDRLPYGEDDRAYNLSLNSLDAMFATHTLSRPGAPDEYRVLLIGDSATWGILLRPGETLAGILTARTYTTESGRDVRAYNLGHPIMSLTKDLLLLDYAMRYEPDMIIWLTTLQSFPRDKQLFPPILQNNANRVRHLITSYDLDLDAQDERFVEPSFLDRTIVGRRREIADWLRLQLFGVMWSLTGIDQFYPDTYDLRSQDFEEDITWQNYTEPKHFTTDDLAFDVVRAGIEIAGDVPILLVNEPTFISSGINSDLRYNFWYPRWAYDSYRELYTRQAEAKGWHYLDLWDIIDPAEFTDSPVHLTPAGSQQLSEIVGAALMALANGDPLPEGNTEG